MNLNPEQQKKYDAMTDEEKKEYIAKLKKAKEFRDKVGAASIKAGAKLVSGMASNEMERKATVSKAISDTGSLKNKVYRGISSNMAKALLRRRG